MPKSDNSINRPVLDSLHRVWKFKKIEIIEDPSGVSRSVSIENYDLWDLTKRDTLKYTLKDSLNVTHSIPYKIADNGILLLLPENEQNIVLFFKIAELNADELKLIMHVTYTQKGKTKSEDIVKLIFEPKS